MTRIFFHLPKYHKGVFFLSTTISIVLIMMPFVQESPFRPLPSPIAFQHGQGMEDIIV
jgi:hypothetical protein